jgi:hypothetical protein
MNNITLTIELCAEDRKRLDVISDTLELIRLAVAEGKTLPPVVAQESAQPEPKAEPTPEAEEAPAKVVELSDIQKKVVELSAAGKKAEVRGIITKYASRVSAIPADKTAEVWEQLTALEG